MSAVYRLIFELSVYYALTGVYMQRYLSVEPSILGMVFLCIGIVLFVALENTNLVQKCALLVPGVALLFEPTLIKILQFLPAWIYIGAILLAQRADVDYDSFRLRFDRSFLVLIPIALPLLNYSDASGILENTAIYLVLFVASGVACLRSLRDNTGTYRQALVLFALMAGCGLATWLGIPQILLNFVNEYFFQMVAKGIALLSVFVALGVYQLFAWLLSLNGGPPEMSSREVAVTTTAQILGVDEALLVSDGGGVFWLETAVYILLTIGVIVGSVFLVRYLIKNGAKLQKNRQKLSWTDEVQYVVPKRRDFKNSRVRPKEPRAIVRYFYGKFMRECQRRGIKDQLDWTSNDYAKAGCAEFNYQDMEELKWLYRDSRYCHTKNITRSQARRAVKLWQNIKRTRQ